MYYNIFLYIFYYNIFLYIFYLEFKTIRLIPNSIRLRVMEILTDID